MSDTESTGATATEARSDEIEAAAERGLVEAPSGAVVLLPGEVRPHPTPFQYVMIGLALVIVTALEVGVFYLEGEIPDGLIIALLLTFAVVKFTLVVSWFMHLRTDRPIFRRFSRWAWRGPSRSTVAVLATFEFWTGGRLRRWPHPARSARLIGPPRPRPDGAGAA